MTDNNSQALPTVESWDTYWRGAFRVSAYTIGGVTHPTIQSFWNELFRAARTKSNTPKIIDIASGSGPVVDSAMTAFAGQLPDFTCLDISASAVKILEQRFPTVQTIVADARQIPLKSAAYDIVTSQFGIEYAGLEAMDELARLVAPRGQLALLLHNYFGSIYEECAFSLATIEKIQQANFVPYAITMFEKGFAAVRGADRAAYEAAAKQLAPAVSILESIMAEYGRHVAGDLVSRLYDDVGTIHENIQWYEPSEVLDWLNRMQDELPAFEGRMASMCDAAIDSDMFERLCENLRRHDFTIVRGNELAGPDQPLPLAWALIANRN